jgi:hypothetical protein
MTPEELRATEEQLARETERGAKARAILDSPLYIEAMTLVEERTLEAWKTSPVRDSEGQLALRLRWQVIQEFKGHFADVLQTGKLAQEQLIAEAGVFERMRELFRKRGMRKG